MSLVTLLVLVAGVGGTPLLARAAADSAAETLDDAPGLQPRGALGVTGFEVPASLLGWDLGAAQQEAGAGAELRSPESYGTRWRLLRATSEIVAYNLIMTWFGRTFFTEGKEGFVVTAESIHENLQAGFEWDDNSFSANNFRHPYQGALYYNAGRANHYDYYESSAFAFLGAWLWEYTGENHHPSVNDWINTAVGGIAFGEALYRLSDLVLDNTATQGRTWREVGGLAVSPIRGVNRLITGEAYAVHANAPDRFPATYDGLFRFGARTIGDERLWNQSSSKLFISFDAKYGDAFGEIKKPFDHFTVGAQLNVDNKPHGIGRIEIQGALGAKSVSQSAKTHHVLSAYQHFDYIDNEAYTYGGQSVGASFRSRFSAEDGFKARASLDMNAILLGASKSDYFSISGREYDYGPGVAFKVEAVFERKGTDVLTLGHESHYIHSINGNEVDSYVHFTRLRAHVPIRAFFGAGFEYLLYSSERDYDTLPDVSQRSPELRVYAGWGR